MKPIVGKFPKWIHNCAKVTFYKKNQVIEEVDFLRILIINDMNLRSLCCQDRNTHLFNEFKWI